MPLRYRRTNMQEMFTSVSNGNLEFLEKYLDHDGDINLADHRGVTLLQQAVSDSNAEKVRLLIGKGCNINTVDQTDCCPLHTAIYQGDNSILEILLEAGADVNGPLFDGMPPLLHATVKENTTAVQLILEKGVECDINFVDKSQQSALGWALLTNNTDIYKLLLHHGVSAKVIYGKKNTVSLVQRLYHNKELMNSFLTLASDVNLHYHLMLACVLQKPDISEMILKSHENPFQLKALGHVLQHEVEEVWEDLTRCIIRPYKLATKCSPENKLLITLLDVCNSNIQMSRRRNFKLRSVTLLRILQKYGLVIHPQTSVKSCIYDCSCRKCIHTALYDLPPVASLKGQCCSVIRQNLHQVKEVSSDVIDTLPLPREIKRFICMSDW